tara:strand:+ start:493 stop:1374 length:882 start_codon:yes stop_codon:yes gene_type:complete
MALWTPSNDSTLFAWFDADSFSARDGGTAAKWANKEGTTARDMIGGSDATTDPQLCGSSDFLNGRAGVEFDQDSGELDILQTSSTVADLDNQPYTVCLVIKDANQADIDYFLYFFEGSNVSSFFQGELAFGGNVYLYSQSGGFSFSPPQSYSHVLTSDEKTALAAGATLTTVADGSNFTPFFNGVALDIGGVPLQQDSTTNAASLVVGALQTLGMDATMYEIVICIGTGANDNVKRIEGYLAHRYARTLPATHRYESFAPASGLHGVHNQDLIGDLALDVSGPLVSDTLAGAV